MMSRKCTTRASLGNGRYPCLIIRWVEDDDQSGWTGFARLWSNSTAMKGEEHQISLRQGQPLGSIYVEVDEAAQAGCWSMATIEGAGLTERDLQWATLFAREAIQRKIVFEQAQAKK
jgi:hypothetical protein